LGGDRLGGTGDGELTCRNEFVESGVEFGPRELSPAWDRGVESNTNGAIDTWQGRSKTGVEYAMEPPEAKDDHALALSDDPNGCGRERGQDCE
jgi:hypothetical protein